MRGTHQVALPVLPDTVCSLSSYALEACGARAGELRSHSGPSQNVAYREVGAVSRVGAPDRHSTLRVQKPTPKDSLLAPEQTAFER